MTQPIFPDANFLTSLDVAILLQVNTRTLNHWARIRKGPPRIKVGRNVFYRRDTLQRWLLGMEEGCVLDAPVARQR